LSEERLARFADILGIVSFFAMPIGPIVFAVLQITSIGGGGLYFIAIIVWIAIFALGICVAYVLDRMASRRARSTPSKDRQ
jgi:hypothetical protein